MHPTHAERIAQQLALSDFLIAGRDTMLNPQDLPGRYGRVVSAIDHVLNAVGCEAVVGGGWAVWRHGFVGRVTQDIDIVLPADQIDEFLKTASVSGFQILKTIPGRWPKLVHKESKVDVDILPEGQRPGTPPDYAPTTIPSPTTMGAVGTTLRYIDLPVLVELKLAAGRMKDKADVVELIRANPDEVATIKKHLSNVHQSYEVEFDALDEQVNKEDRTGK